MSPEPRRATTVLNVLLAAAVLVSIVHYADNTVRFDDYDPDPGLVTQPVIPVAWVAFTAFGGWGWLQYRAGNHRRAALGLAVYSGSGLVGPVHYTVVSPSDLDAFQNAFVVLDTLLGAAVLAFACWLALRPPSRSGLEPEASRSTRGRP